MKIALISFTSSGKKISSKIKSGLDSLQENLESTDIVEIDKSTFDDKLSNHMNYIFDNYDAIVFVSSTGIAVRFIAPYIKSKCTDPAVIVVDDLGKYTISLLSGHIGGANELSAVISNILKNQAIITTASDARGIDAVDVFAKRNGFYIEDMESAKILTAFMVEGEKIKLISEVETGLKYDNVEMIFCRNAEEIEALEKRENSLDTMSYSNETDILKDESKGIIIVSSIENIENYSNPLCIILRPKNLNIGIGCRRGKSSEEILSFIIQIFKDNNLSLKSINKIGTIDIKHDEIGIIEASKELGAEMILFSRDEIESVSDKFTKSNFVKSNVGVTSVCEPSAYLLGQKMIVSKQICNGITIAVSRSE